MTPDELIDPQAKRESRERATCPACIERRPHTETEWSNHPLRGHGFSPETGWTHPTLGEAKYPAK